MFRRGLRLGLNPRQRLHFDFPGTDSAWDAEEERLQRTPEGIVRRNMAVAPEYLHPTEQDRIRRQEQTTPHIPDNPASVNIARAGVSVPLSAIGDLLGMNEDVSPVVGYTLTHTSRVRIIIFASGGDTVVARPPIWQRPGKHTFTWDMRNGDGERVPPGNYIAEIVIGDDERVLKRVLVQ
jgi:hypothetical protein